MNTIVSQKFNSYPSAVKPIMLQLRELIFEAAREEGIELEETLKWGEPAYLCRQGSTVRIDWKSKSPDTVQLYFNCKTILVETFKELYFDELNFEGKRAIVLATSEDLPTLATKHCVSLALRYHKIKHLPLLGQ